MKKYWLFLVLMVLLLLASEAVSQKFIQIFLPKGEVIKAELAVTSQERQRGLMFREKLKADQGMLFVFTREGLHSFWMKNMQIPLDILWLDKDKRVVHIEKEVPACLTEDCPSYAPRVPALYVLELQSGSVDRCGIKMYDRIDFILPGLQ